MHRVSAVAHACQALIGAEAFGVGTAANAGSVSAGDRLCG